MHQNQITPDDPRLTAYALDEMEPAERIEFARQLAENPAAQHAVVEIQEASRTLERVLAWEEAQPAKPSPARVDPRRSKQDFQPIEGGSLPREGGRKYLRFPHFYFAITGLAAACFAVFFLLSESTPHVPTRQYVEVPLTSTLADKTAVELPALSADRLSASGADYGAADFRRDRAFVPVSEQPSSTFPLKVDPVSYADIRRKLTKGQRPLPDAVRIEELVNYFSYRYAPPTGDAPLAASLEVADAPWAPLHRLVRIGLKGREVDESARPAANLVFLLEVGGSMQEPNKLPLIKQSLRQLVNKLPPNDRVAVVVYGAASGVALPFTRVGQRGEVLAAIDRLEPDDAPESATGIQLAYALAQANFTAGGINRVILVTDGDLNLGIKGEGRLAQLIEQKFGSGISFSALGVGLGRKNEVKLRQFAEKGNGRYDTIASVMEAKKALLEQTGGALPMIAREVKLQVEFNPATVQAYRLLGYDNRLLANDDFNRDKIDSGEIEAGHEVTALYEVVPVPEERGRGPSVAALDSASRSEAPLVSEARSGQAKSDLLTLKIRYREPGDETEKNLEFSIHDSGAHLADASQDFKFAAAVAGFGLVLRDSPFKGTLTLKEVAELGRAGTDADPGGYRNEFVSLVERARRTVQ